MNTEMCMKAGILNRPVLKTQCPEDFDGFYVDEDTSAEDLLKGLQEKGLEAAIYYGCWNIWKTENGYSGELLQYRVVTEHFENENIEFAFEKAKEWFAGCVG